MMKMIRCSSPICITQDGVKGRMFEPGTGLNEVWCEQCIKLSAEMNFYANQTATMIRTTYQEYIETDLPKEVKLILEQFTRELIKQLGEEL